MHIKNWYIISQFRKLCEQRRFFHIVLSGASSVTIQIGMYQTKRGVKIFSPQAALIRLLVIAHTSISTPGNTPEIWGYPGIMPYSI
jgi:hypothetical protein